MIRRGIIALAALVVLAAFPVAAQASFGFVPGKTKVIALDREGRAVTEAGAHPYEFTVEFELNQEEGTGLSEGGELRDVIIDLPPGFVGDPEAVPQCTRQQFEGPTPRCPGSTQVGMLRATNPGLGETINPIYNVEPPPGVALQLGFAVFTYTVVQNVSVRTDEGYGGSVAAPNIPVEVTSARAIIWGTPADSSHDSERVCVGTTGCSTDAPREPFLTMPTSCGAFPMTVKADTRANPGEYVTETVSLTNPSGVAAPLVACDAVPFNPTIFTAPSASSGETSSGLNFKLSLPNSGLLDPEAITETEPVKAEIALPRGITVNPSAANGIGVCTPGQYNAASCPESSKLGTLFANTPLLHEPIEGALYLAAPHDNPFNSLLALYVVARVPNRGILVKQAGEVHADPVTGQLTTTFDHLPPLPYSSFEVKLREGPRAPLITPQTCGSFTTDVRLYPFSAPGSPVQRSVPFTISSGANGGNCASSEGQLPNHPAFEAGTTNPLGGTYSPFIFKVSRADGTQRFAGIEAKLPPGLTGKLAGIPYCSEAQIAAATARSAEGQGALELASPSCPAASQVGIVNVSAGAGSSPYYVQGKAYLAGPYRGAPLSLAIVTPAIAGPFDLGTVVVRTALYVDPFTAQIRPVSDPLPTILSGIPLDVRSVSLQMNRSNFTLNPTSCDAMKITGSVMSTAGQSAPLSNRFQVGACRGLKFAPKLKLILNGATRRAGHPALKAVVSFPKGMSANVARAQVGLPHSEFLDQGSIKTVCKQADLRAGTCPKKSIYGRAKAWTPLLDKPLQGPVYLGVGFGHKLPDLVADLSGQVRILAHGKVDTTKHEGLRNTFEAVPDAPVSKFILEMKGGPKKGLLENSTNICKGKHKAEVRFTAHNGKVVSFKVPLTTGCGLKKGKRGGHGSR